LIWDENTNLVVYVKRKAAQNPRRDKDAFPMDGKSIRDGVPIAARRSTPAGSDTAKVTTLRRTSAGRKSARNRAFVADGTKLHAMPIVSSQHPKAESMYLRT
jgi:hypothetical protein